MLLEPTAIVFYVENLREISLFYRDVLGIAPEEASPSFHAFPMSKGMRLALKARPTVLPAVSANLGTEDGKSGPQGELAFVLESPEKVDGLFTEWQKKNIRILQKPSLLPFGYAFVALDPEGNRLRVLSLAGHQ